MKSAFLFTLQVEKCWD